MNDYINSFQQNDQRQPPNERCGVSPIPKRNYIKSESNNDDQGYLLKKDKTGKVSISPLTHT
jgi:hypothetical protein